MTQESKHTDANYILDRGHQQYLDIENFMPYEKINCISFEMAIRNSTVQFILNFLYKNEEALYEKEHNYYKYANQLYIELQNIYYVPFEATNYLNSYTFLSTRYINQWKTKLENYNENNCFIYNDHESSIYLGHMSTRGFNSELSINNAEEYYKFTSPTDHHYHIIDEEVLDHLNDNTLENIIEPNFSRPILNAPIYNNINLTLTKINLYLPENEIIEYIKHIRNNIIKLNSSITTIAELDCQNLDKTFNDTQHFKGISLIQLANMFYTYDARQLNMSYELITEKIYHHTNCMTSIKTCKKNYHKMIEYIDNLSYKQFIAPYNKK